MPATVIDLMGAIPKLDYLDMDSLGEAILALADAEDDGAFKKYDEVVNQRLRELKKEDRFASVDDLADAFLADLNRMNFSGIARDDLNRLMRQAMLDTIKHVDQVHHGKVLQRMVELAKESNIDIRRLRYATMDNTLWFPAWVGEGGAADFHWQVSHAPVAKPVTSDAVAVSGEDTAKDKQ
jgi:Arc/MetJ-type ribon-helix-helix transcriptional regulator